MALRDFKDSTIAGTSGTATLPTIVNGDYVVALVVTDDFTKAPTISGFVQQADLSISAPDGQSARLLSKVGTGTEGSSITVSNLATGDTSVIIASWSGRNTSSPFTFTPHVVTSTADSASPISISDTVTGTAAAGDDVAMFAMCDSHGVAGWVFTSIAGGLTMQVSHDAAWVPSMLMTTDNVAGGALGTITARATNAGNNAGWGSVVIALAQGSGVVTPTVTVQPLFFGGFP